MGKARGGFRMAVALLAASFASALPVEAAGARGGINAGERQAVAKNPFTAREIARFDTPWAIAFLPDGRLLVTEKPGRMFLVAMDGTKTAIDGVPAVAASGQNGLLDVAVSPDFDRTGHVYISYVAAGQGGSVLSLARARLEEGEGRASLTAPSVIWTQHPPGGRGQPGGIIAFAPDGRHLFLTSGDRMMPQTAQDPAQTMGKILRLGLDGSVPPDNPWAGRGGVEAQTWSLGHRNPYGLAFDASGVLWEHEMGPRGGDELNRIERGRDYGWPAVSNGDQYSGAAIPRHSTRPEFAAPPLYWNPVIAPAGLAFYHGKRFPGWQGSALIGGLAALALVRVGFGEDGLPDEAERYDMGARIRDVAEGPDGAVYVIEDDSPGRLLRLEPAGG